MAGGDKTCFCHAAYREPLSSREQGPVGNKVVPISEGEDGVSGHGQPTGRPMLLLPWSLLLPSSVLFPVLLAGNNINPHISCLVGGEPAQQPPGGFVTGGRDHQPTATSRPTSHGPCRRVFSLGALLVSCALPTRLKPKRRGGAFSAVAVHIIRAASLAYRATISTLHHTAAALASHTRVRTTDPHSVLSFCLEIRPICIRRHG